MLWIGALWLAAGPLAAQTASLDTSTSSSSEPCSSARAVHDLRCPNYTGFKTRVGARSALSEFLASGAEHHVDALPRGLGLKPGRVLQRGLASWYGPGFHGRKTASGERYDMHELTAAHKTLPFGTRVLVHNPRTGRQVVVRINDRGPFAAGRVIDLSRAAAAELGIVDIGHDAVVLHELADAGDTQPSS